MGVLILETGMGREERDPLLWWQKPSIACFSLLQHPQGEVTPAPLLLQHPQGEVTPAPLLLLCVNRICLLICLPDLTSSHPIFLPHSASRA